MCPWKATLVIAVLLHKPSTLTALNVLEKTQQAVQKA